MRIQHNIQAIRAQRQTSMNSNAASKSLEKLSSGFAINRAADGAASLAISEKMRSQIRGLERASSNAQDSISLMQTAEGALQETQSILQRMRELSVQSANGIYQAEDRQKIDDEFKELSNEITRIADNTKFNDINVLNPESSAQSLNFADGGISLSTNNLPAGASNIRLEVATPDLDNAGGATTWDDTDTVDLTLKYTDASGNEVTDTQTLTSAPGDETVTFAGGTEITVTNFDPTKNGSKLYASQDLSFQIGASSSESISVSIDNMNADSLGVKAGTAAGEVNVQTVANANNALTAIDSAISKVSSQRAKLGSTQNRIEHAINNLGVSVENLTAAESRIRDVDMAKEMMNFTKNNILMQASQSMLAQANAQPQSVLQLLG